MTRLSRLLDLPPRTLLRVDAAGAAVSAVLLGVVLRSLVPVTGMPPGALACLAALPVLFVAYDLACLRTSRGDDPRALAPIGWMNAGYCVVSGAFVAYHGAAGRLTALGWAYFGGEMVIVAGLATVQLLGSGRRGRPR